MLERMERTTCGVCGLVDTVCSVRHRSRVIAKSAVMQELLKRAKKFASTDAPLVVFGESGTGKEVVARTVHASGKRAEAPFVAVNVAALPAELLESELFGHAKGSFTGADRNKTGLFEEANGGTIFLDEIGEMPLPLQAKLLRALQDGEIRRVGDTRSFGVDVRVICATHRDLAELVRRGTFREDLYYRLKVLSLRVPPLRDRREDILPLARHFLSAEGTAKELDATCERALLEYRWPGNVRELQSAMKHGAALATGKTITAADLPDEIHVHERASNDVVLRPLVEVEREHVLAVLDACHGSQAEAARVLGIGRNTLWRKMRAFALEPTSS